MKITTRAIIVNHQNQLLLVQHHGSNFWSLPGGKVEMGEDLKSGLKREILEELGVHCSVENLLYINEFQYSPASDITVEFFFSVKISEEKIEKLRGEKTTAELHKIQWMNHQNIDIKPEFLKNHFDSSKGVDCFLL